MTGLTKFVFCSIASMEKSEDLPFWIRAFIALELFIDVWSSIPTCVAESFWVIFAGPNLTIRFEGGRFREKTTILHLVILNEKPHFLEYLNTISRAFSKDFMFGDIRARSSARVGLPSLRDPIVQPVPDSCNVCKRLSMKSRKNQAEVTLPWRAPCLIGKAVDFTPFTKTWLDMSL